MKPKQKGSCRRASKKMRDASANELRERVAMLSKGISHPARLEIVSMLARKQPDCPCICGEIVEALPLAQSSVSEHLKILKETGWITAEPKGTSMCYCLVHGILDEYKNLMDNLIVNNKTVPA